MRSRKSQTTARFKTAVAVPVALAVLVPIVFLHLGSAPSEGRQNSAHTVSIAPAGPTPVAGEAIPTPLKPVGVPGEAPSASATADTVTSFSGQQVLDPPSHGKGFVPPPMDLSHLTAQRRPGLHAAESLPSSFDWRDKDGADYVTSVKDQRSCGACYAFAALGDLESKLLIEGAGSYDLSENNAKECNWYETSCAGGDYRTVVDLFSKQGTVLESCDPYVAGDVPCTAGCAYQQTVLDWRIISGDDVPDSETLKRYVYTYGPVYVSMYAGNGDAWDSEFGSYDGTYTLHYSGAENPNHAVLIVGWDDTLVYDGGSGGWIVKNSWGISWGDDGYFRIAYGSASMGKWASFVEDWQPHDEHGELWYYDEGGWSANVGTGSATTAWGLATFTPDQHTSAVRVELWTTDATTDVDVYLYDDFDGSTLSGLLGQSVNHSFDEAGYHSILLDEPVALNTDDDVAAVVKVTNATYVYPIAADRSGAYELGRTYFSSSGGSWIDLGAELQVDAAIRLRTKTIDAPMMADFSAEPTSGPAPLHVQFTNNSTGDYDTCTWEFGDGETNNDCTDPTHEYTQPGTYTPTLTVSGPEGSDTLTRTDYVVVYEGVVADFSASPTSGVAPLTVDFTNLSAGDYDTCSWDFGDGVTSTLESPTHVYAAVGAYTVTLSVDGPGGSDTEVKPTCVIVQPSQQYTLDVTIVGDGVVTKEPDQATYQYGDVVTLTATSDLGWTFKGWSGSVQSTDNPLTLVIQHDTDLTATFTELPPKVYGLAVDTVGNGTVALDPAGGVYDDGTVVELTAEADPGWRFSGWSGHLSGDANPASITMDEHKSVTAAFVEAIRIYLPLVVANH